MGQITEKLNERKGLEQPQSVMVLPFLTPKLRVRKTQVLFIRFSSKVDFSAADEKMVDIVFSIIAPETCQSEHLLILSSISNFLKKRDSIEKIRKQKTAEGIYKLFEDS